MLTATFANHRIIVIRALLPLFLLMSSVFSAQAEFNADSLRKQFEDTSQPIEKRQAGVRALYRHYRYHQQDSALLYSKQELAFAEGNQNQRLLVAAYLDMAEVHSLRQEPLEAVGFIDKALKICKKEGFRVKEGTCYNMLGIAYATISDFEVSLNYFRKAQEHAVEMGDSIARVSSLNNLANLYTKLERYQHAEDLYQELLGFCKNWPDRSYFSTAHTNLGFLYIHTQQYDKSIQILSKALLYFEETGERVPMANTLLGIGTAYAEQEEWVLALPFARRSSELFQACSHRIGTAETYILMGTIQAALGDADAALVQLERALKLHQEADYLVGLQEANLALYDFYKTRSQPEKTLLYFERYTALKDSIKELKNKENIVASELRYELLRQRQLDSLSFEQLRETERMEQSLTASQTRFNYLLGIAILILLGSGGCVYWMWKYQRSKAEKRLLLQQVSQLKSVFEAGPQVEFKGELNRERIEASLEYRLNETDWAILDKLYQSPGLTNRELADKVFVGFEGVRSSLKKMYRQFDIDSSSGNQKASLVLKALELSSGLTQPLTSQVG